MPEKIAWKSVFSQETLALVIAVAATTGITLRLIVIGAEIGGVCFILSSFLYLTWLTCISMKLTPSMGPFLHFLIVAVPGTAAAGLFLSPPPAVSTFLLILNITIWSILGFGGYLSDEGLNFDSALASIGIVWGIASIFIFLGSLPYFEFSESLVKYLAQLSPGIEPRFVPGLGILGLALLRSFFEALKMDQPVLTSFEARRLPDQDLNTFAGAVLAPVVVLSNALLVTVFFGINLIWQALQFVGKFIMNFGKIFASTMVSLIANTSAWFVMTTISLFAALLLVPFALFRAIDAMPRTYLIESEILRQLPIFVKLSIVVSALLLCICVGLTLLVLNSWKDWAKEFRRVSYATFFGLTWTIMIIFLTGLVMHAAIYLKLNIAGFGHFGIFSWGVIALFSLGFIYSFSGRPQQRSSVELPPLNPGLNSTTPPTGDPHE